jgi:hypothetical protein
MKEVRRLRSDFLRTALMSWRSRRLGGSKLTVYNSNSMNNAPTTGLL